MSVCRYDINIVGWIKVGAKNLGGIWEGYGSKVEGRRKRGGSEDEARNSEEKVGFVRGDRQAAGD